MVRFILSLQLTKYHKLKFGEGSNLLVNSDDVISEVINPNLDPGYNTKFKTTQIATPKRLELEQVIGIKLNC